MPSSFDYHKAEISVLLELRAVVEAMRQGHDVEAAINKFSFELQRREYPTSYIYEALHYARKEASKS